MDDEASLPRPRPTSKGTGEHPIRVFVPSVVIKTSVYAVLLAVTHAPNKSRQLA